MMGRHTYGLCLTHKKHIDIMNGTREFMQKLKEVDNLQGKVVSVRMAVGYESAIRPELMWHRGKVIKCYPDYVLIDFGHFRECLSRFEIASRKTKWRLI